MYNRLFKSFLRGSYEGSINAPKLNLVDSERILRITNRVVERAAANGNCVIVRRGWQQFLKNRPGTLRVLLYAPREHKVPPASESWQNRKGSREELVDSVERECADFIQEYFKIEWPDARFITLMNTASGDEAIVDMILSCRQTPEARGAA